MREFNRQDAAEPGVAGAAEPAIVAERLRRVASPAPETETPAVGAAARPSSDGAGEEWVIVDDPASAVGETSPLPPSSSEQTEPQAEPHTTALPAATSEPQTGREKRRAPRKVHALAAQLHTSPGAPGIPCMVTDMSATGARIKLIPGTGRNVTVAELPERLILLLRLDRTQYHCEIVRREESSFGVRFLSAPTAAPPDARRTSLSKARAQHHKATEKKSWF